MRPVLLLCVAIAVLCGAIRCDHHPDQEQGEDPPTEVLQGHQKQEDHGQEQADPPVKETLTYQRMAEVNAVFGFRFYKLLAAGGHAGNILFSPLSISTALAMLSVGAKADTLNQILEGLGFNHSEITDKEMHRASQQMIRASNVTTDGHQLSMGNALFVHEDLKILPSFQEHVKEYYNSQAFSRNLNNEEESKKQINDYLNEQTLGKITQLLEGFQPSSQMVLVNYIYFNGNWKKPFNPAQTKPRDFFVDETTVVQVPMMSSYTTHRWGRDSDLDCTLVELAYTGNVSALLVLPDEGKLKQVEEGLSSATLQKWQRLLHPRILNLQVPKFSISVTLRPEETLKSLGIRNVFNDRADLSGITGDWSPRASKAVHKAALSFDERGAEAAGATILDIAPLFFVSPITFNRPFLLFILKDSCNIVLFAGKISNPIQE